MRTARVLTKPDCGATPKFGMWDPGNRYEVTECEYEFLQQALKIHRKVRGYTTPIEEFLTKLIRAHSGHPLDPWDIEKALEECRHLNFDDAIKTTADNVINYADFVKAEIPDGWFLTIRKGGS